MLCDEFFTMVDDLVSGEVRSIGAELDEARQVGGRCEVVFRIRDEKILVFWSPREGEVNCKISSALEADIYGTGTYINTIIGYGKGLSTEALIALLPEKPPTISQQLRDIAQKIKTAYQDA
jgi:hypothetical protein